MKKIILGIFLGLLLHKGLNVIYDYNWEKTFNSQKCIDSHSLSLRFQCVYKNMGISYYFQYILIRPIPDYSIMHKTIWKLGF